VGEGPFPTEIHGPLAEQIRKQGNEFGSTTGRPRRIGHFDAVLGAYSARLNTLDGIALTLLDVLSGIEDLKICVGYKLGGKVLTTPPAHPLDFNKIEPMYLSLKGWEEDITGVRSKEDLPANAQIYLEAIEDLLEVPVKVVSVGKERDQTFKIDV
jgi:adenylosuccinate synthase